MLKVYKVALLYISIDICNEVKLILFGFDVVEHITSIVASMIKNCQATQRQRLVNKFTENDHEKVGIHDFFHIY